jgi:hypothetical protein
MKVCGEIKKFNNIYRNTVLLRPYSCMYSVIILYLEII